LIYDFVHSSAPTDPGIYIFGRLHSKKFEALYVGKAKNLQSRTKGQLKNLKLMLHLKGAKTGTRVVLLGRFRAATGQQSDRCLPILEKALIRHFLSEGHDLVNIQGTQVKRHEISTVGSKHIPKLIFVDRGKKE
jgi:hypothetical protein